MSKYPDIVKMLKEKKRSEVIKGISPESYEEFDISGRHR